MPRSLHFRLADPSDVATLFDIRQAAIRQLTLTHLSDYEAAAQPSSGSPRPTSRKGAITSLSSSPVSTLRGFYPHLGYTTAAAQCSSAAIAMRKQVAGERPDKSVQRTAFGGR